MATPCPNRGNSEYKKTYCGKDYEKGMSKEIEGNKQDA